MKTDFIQVLAFVSAIAFSTSVAAIDWNITGSVRQEIGVNISADKNEFNEIGNPFQGLALPALTNNPLNAGLRRTDGQLANANNAPVPTTCKFQTLFGCPGAPGVNLPGAALRDDFMFNLFTSRVDLDIKAQFNRSFAATAKVRAVYDATSNFTDGRSGDSFGSTFWHGDTDSANPLEVSGNNMALDLPGLYLDYHTGSFWIRAGQQSIAWGEALFFRVMDVANGLDLRRHLTLGPAAEEFQDQRIASPGIRVSYTFDNNWELDTFAQLFTPSVLPGVNTPYNVTPAAFSWDNEDEMDDARGAINFGARLSMPLTDSFTFIGAFSNRRNPDGVVRWTDAPLNNPSANTAFGRENPFCAGASNNPFAAIPGAPTRASLAGRCGSFFAVDSTATASAQEWFYMSGKSRLNPVAGVRASINEAPASAFAARTILGLGDEVSALDAVSTLDAFYTGFGPLRGYITHEYKRENIIMLGGNYIFSGKAGGFLDQLIVRGEVSVTPDKQFTSTSLSREFISETEVVSALIVEKYHNFVIEIPAAYMVAQWMHRTESDLFGRHLSGNENRGFLQYVDPATGAFNAGAEVAGSGQPSGQSSADYVAFAIQQPFSDLVWRVDFATLIDIQGGVYLQPGARYRPSASWQWDFYANVVVGNGSDNDSIMQSLDYGDEIFMRATYTF